MVAGRWISKEKPVQRLLELSRSEETRGLH